MVVIKYVLNDMESILERLRNKEHIIITDSEHFLDNTKRKYCEYGVVYSLIKNDLPIYMKLSKNNKFLVFYNHPESDKYHVKVVIFIKNLDEIRLVTTFPTERRRGKFK